MIGILDIQGINLSILRKPELINFVKEFVGMIDAHYPSRAYKTYMINAPHWFSALYKLVSPIMRETTKEKIVLFSAGPQQDAALQAALGVDMAATVTKALRVPSRQEKHKKPKHD
jgi:CRAL/TRIO domain